jgi:hypothetical protein
MMRRKKLDKVKFPYLCQFFLRLVKRRRFLYYCKKRREVKMKKLIIIQFIFFFVLAGSSIKGEALKSGEAAIFLRDGGKVIGEIVDISSRRMVLELKDAPKIKLANIWMINFVNKNWYFPKERVKIRTAEHYLFRKNGDITSGKIIDFSSRRRVFEFESGEKIGIGSVKRIYFSKSVPDPFKKPKKTKKPIKLKKPVKIKKVIK